MKRKFCLICNSCSNEISGFSQWFQNGQSCPKCGFDQTEVKYEQDFSVIKELFKKDHSKRDGLWRYFDFLPVNSEKNIVTCGEGSVQIDRWFFLEKFAREKYGINCKVYAHRHDNNYATGTFKDLAGSIVASVLKENGIKQYVVFTTGNIGVAYSRYLSEAEISLYVFIPDNSSKAQEAEIGCFGQKVFRVKGDYTCAKEMAMEFSKKFHIPLAAGSFDPMRIEAKKTMVYEWLRLIPDFPTVYIQALSGGTGPLGIVKGYTELSDAGLINKIPRLILVQTDKCSPMADAWSEAKAKNFPKNWGKRYPVYQDPTTIIPTLATGNPVAYPVLSQMVYKSEGEIITFPEDKTINVARLVAFEASVRIGPAAAIAVGGFLAALKDTNIREGDIVMLAIGEGIRRSPDFMEKLIYTTTNIGSVAECHLCDRNVFRKTLWERVDNFD
jgi:threonine synthase